MRHVREPRGVAALRPPQGDAVPERRRNPAPEKLPRGGAVALPVDEILAREPQRPLHVLAGGVLRELRRARRRVEVTRGLRVGDGVVGEEIERGGGIGIEIGGGAFVGGEAVGGGDGGEGGRRVVPEAEEV